MCGDTGGLKSLNLDCISATQTGHSVTVLWTFEYIYGTRNTGFFTMHIFTILGGKTLTFSICFEHMESVSMRAGGWWEDELGSGVKGRRVAVPGDHCLLPPTAEAVGHGPGCNAAPAALETGPLSPNLELLGLEFAGQIIPAPKRLVVQS